MGVDIECIIPHKMSLQEIIHLPEMIDHHWEDLRAYIQKESKSFDNPITPERMNIAAQWEFLITEQKIEDYWKYNEDEGTSIPFPDNNIGFFCYFGMVKVHRRTIVISPFNLRFKTIFNDDKAKKSLVKIVRKITSLFGAKVVLYCADSAMGTEILNDLAASGKTLNEILAFAHQRLGPPQSDYLRALDEAYFVDFHAIDLDAPTSSE